MDNNNVNNDQETQKIRINKIQKYAYATWWLIPRHTSLEEKTTRRPSKIKKDIGGKESTPSKNYDDNVISFVYSEQPYACDAHEYCPMRFSDKTKQQAHDVRCHGLILSPPDRYRCRSCLRTNRKSMFSTKEAYWKHMMNPGVSRKSVTR